MIINNVFRGIGLVFVMMSVVWIVMAGAPGIEVTNPAANPATVNVNYVNVTVTTNGTTGAVNLSWDGTNQTMLGFGNSFYLNQTNLSNRVYTYIVYASDGLGNWSPSGSRTVNVSVSASPPSITAYEPATTVNSINGTLQKFNVTVDQDASVSWKIDGVEYQNNSETAGKSEYSNSTALPATYTVTAMANNVNGNSSTITWTWTVKEPALGPVTGLTLDGKGATWIKWIWTNPGAPFNHTMVKINGTFQTNTSDQFYNYTSFSPGTLNTISLQTVDISGNIDSNSVPDSQYTMNTQTGTNVPVQLTGNLKVIFSQVTAEGNTTVTVSPTRTGGESDPTFSKIGSYYYISPEGGLSFTSPITVELNYTPPAGINESNIKLYHWESGSWVDRTTSIDVITHRITGNLSSFSAIVAGAPPGPSITYDPTASTIDDLIVGQSKIFRVTPTTQDVTVIWTIDGSLKETDIVNVSQDANYTFAATSQGNFTLMANASNANGSVLQNWTINVHSKTYSTGNRVWDGSKDMSTTYTWSPMSFYAFYYDVDGNVGSESLEIKLNSKTDRNVAQNNLLYKTTPEDVDFKYSAWGSYRVLGFMAEKYFASYTASSTIPDVDPISPLNYKQLHKVLKDDKTTFTVRASSTYQLDEGYSVTVKDVGAGREAMISILKDGGEVYTDIKGTGETLVYTKKVGSISDLPIIVLHIGSVFMGTTENMVQINGIFQISESYTSVNQNNNYGIMEIKSVSDSEITMRNDNSFTLSSGSIVDIMGEMKFIVAENDSVLRFAPMVKKTGEYEVRGTISNNETEFVWTPLNFEGFYYNLDDGIGTENMQIKLNSGRAASEGQIVYTTTATPVSYKYSSLGQYNVIGFMAEQYFAGYIAGSITDKDISTIGRNQLHKVLIDDDTQRVIYAGSTLTLNEGYVLKIKDVNMGAGTAEVWLSLLKDGTEVDEGVVSAKDYYIYAPPKVGVISDLPIIALRIESIFRGTEATAAFVKGAFQISESYTAVNNGDTFDEMEVSGVSGNSITMTNPNTVSLDAGSSDTLMRNIRLKVADDSSVIRYYPYILVNGSAHATNQLEINVPSSMMVKDVISISITSGSGTPQDNAEVSFDGDVIGTTNSTGILEYALTKAGQYNFTATKLGYESAIKSVKIDPYVDNRLNFELPEIIDQYIPVSIMVKVSGTGNATSGADITLDGTSIGTTDSSGTLTYTFTSSGTHNLAASKTGFISVQREVNVRMPFTEFKALDINFMPEVVSKGQKVYVWANITNSGTKEGTLPVALMINDTVVENSNITLAPGINGEVNFSHKVELPPGNYTVKILGQKTTMPVKEEPLNLFLIAGVITVIGAIAILFMTSKEIISIEAFKAKLNMGPATNKPVFNTEAIDRAIKDLMSKFKKK
jgi:S-layer protein (TIGR01567 family)